MIKILAEQDLDVSTPLLRSSRMEGLEVGLNAQESVASEPMQFPDPDIHKIAILQCNEVGSFISVLPALQALRFAYPRAEIVFLGLDWHREFLAGRPGVIDRVEVVPNKNGSIFGQLLDELERFFERMQAEHFDIALQLHDGGLYANPFVKRLGARLTVGLRAHDAIPLDRWIPYHLYQSDILRDIEVVSLVGANLISLEPRLAVTEADISEAHSRVPLQHQPLAVLQPGTSDPRRRWPAENFVRVGDALAWAGAHVVVVGSEDYRESNEEIVQAMSAEGQNLSGQLSLKGLAGLLSQASVTVSNDADYLHLAAAVGSATVGIYWCADLITSGPITRTRHRPAISWKVNCPVCGLDSTRHDCKHEASFVSEIQDIEVTTYALELLRMPSQSSQFFYGQKE